MRSNLSARADCRRDIVSRSMVFLVFLSLLLIIGQTAFACIETHPVANIRYRLEGGSWSSLNSSLTVCKGTKVMFMAAENSGYVASKIDYDYALNADRGEHETNVFSWWFELDSNWDAGTLPAAPMDASGTSYIYTFNTAGTFKTLLWVDDYPGASTDDPPASRTIMVNVVEPGIDTDSNNDGFINELDDPIEENAPGRLIQKSALAQAKLSCASITSFTNWILQLSYTNTDKISVYANSDGTGPISTGTSYTIGQNNIPEYIYIKGNDIGLSDITWTMKTPQGVAVCSDTIKVTVTDPQIDNDLPIADINSGAGLSRSNIRWSSSNPNIFYGDEFTLPAGNWTIDAIRVWAVPDVPILPAYDLGDHFRSVALYLGASSSTPTAVCTGTLTTGSSSVTASPVGKTITCTKTSYDGGVSYEAANGTFNQIWQIDFKNLNLPVIGGTAYAFGVYGEPRIDRYWFLHATKSSITNPIPQILRFDISNLSAGTLVDPSGWFMGNGTDINIQVFTH